MKEKCLRVILLIIFISACSTESNEKINFLQYEWEVARPGELGIDENQIQTAFLKCVELSYLNSILIIRHGKIASEKYFNGYNKNSFYTIRSVSKSFLSAAIGIAIDQGIISFEDKLTEIMSEFKMVINDDRFYDVTIGHLIKMKSGLNNDRNIYFPVVNSNNWLSKIFQLNLTNNPGEKFVYSTPGTHLLSAVLTIASGFSSLDFVSENLLVKMGIEINDWEKDPQGIYFGGNNMYFTTRNMAVLGQLYLNNGLLNNTQIVPKYWVEESLKDQSGGIGNWGVLRNIGYGYLWWLGEINDYKIFIAIGHGGQYILCVPDLDLIVATNASLNIGWGEANNQELAILQLIGDYIIPAVIK